MAPKTPSEKLARFVIFNRWFKPSGRFNAFMPKDGKTSVFRISNISDDEIWDIGDLKVAPKRGKPILGRADISALYVIAKGLEVHPNEPPERHADIAGWPDEKSKQKEIALDLAAEARFYKK
ncbi:MAG: hypothetical protein ACE5HI_20245 [bacterium]